MAYLPVNARSELVTPTNFADGGVADTTFMFQAASPASATPALRPTRGSGLGGPVGRTGMSGAAAEAGAAVAAGALAGVAGPDVALDEAQPAVCRPTASDREASWNAIHRAP